MTSSKNPKSFQELLKQRQQSSFVGREDQVALFRQNLEFGLEDERRRFLFNVWGQGGVGKTTLLGQFRSIAEKAKCLAAYIDEGERDVPGVMERLAADLERQGHKLAQFGERYRVYRQKREELEADPNAPQGFSAFLGRTVAKSAIKFGKQVPGAGIAFEFVDEETVTNQAGEWATYLAKKLTNKDEVHLLKEPLEVLTPLFLEDWGKIAEKVTLAFLFDTYERTGEFLDEWLRDVLQGNYGPVPSNFLWVIAGREELDRNRWAEYEGVIARLPLEPFSEEEAQQYLARKGVIDERTIEVILNLSGRFPLLVAMLAEGSPNHPEQVGDPSGKAVERFLKWETDSKRRQIALDAALPRCLNRDVIAQLRPDDGADDLFVWLKQKPFVRERTDGWAYHEVVRTQMLHHKRLTTPQGWADLHGKLAEYYDTLRNNLQLAPEKCQRDSTWQSHTLNVLYHRLCQLPQKHLPIALNEFLAALKNQRTFAEEWAEVIAQAGRDTKAAEVQRWGEQLVEGLKAYSEDRYEVTVAMFKALVEHPDIESQWLPIALGWRGETYRLMERYEEALQDFDQAIPLDPKYAWAIASRGQTYQAMERYEEALQDFNQAIELDPKSAWKLASRGKTYQVMERYEEALQDFNLAIQLDPKYDWAIALRGLTYRIMERYEEALQDFNQAIELDPKSAWKLASRGKTYQVMERYEEALQDFNQAIELNPQNAPTIASRGQIYRLVNRYDKALLDFNQAIELDPEYAWALAQRGATYSVMGNYKAALRDFDAALKLDPKNIVALVEKVPLLFREKAFYELAKIYEKLSQQPSEYLGLLQAERSLSSELLHQLQQQQASVMGVDKRTMQIIIEENLKLLQLDQEALSKVFQSKAAYCNALGDKQSKNFSDSLVAFHKAVELDPSNSAYWLGRGELYLLMKHYDEALQNFNQAIQLNPGYDLAIGRRGETYLLIERYREALIDFNRAIELNKQNDWRLYNRAITYQALEQVEPAKTDLAQAIHLAQADYKKDPERWNNTFNLALYCLAAGEDEQAKHFYRDAIRRGAPAPSIEAAIQDLQEFLTVFSNHALARAAHQFLQQAWQKVQYPT